IDRGRRAGPAPLPARAPGGRPAAPPRAPLSRCPSVVESPGSPEPATGAVDRGPRVAGGPGSPRESDRMRVLPRHRPRESKGIASRHRILNLIFREGRCSRLSLARRLNINASTIGHYVDEFLREGVLLEDHAGPTRRGRSPVPVWLNPAYGGFLGVDLEALRVRTVLVDLSGEVVAQEEVG